MRILVDAEHSYMQPAIDAIAIALQQTYNKNGAVIMNTYQCYLKVSSPVGSTCPSQLSSPGASRVAQCPVL